MCNLIPASLVRELAKKHGVDRKARTYTPWSHVVSLLYAQLTHAIGLNDVCANKERNSDMMEKLFWGVLEHLQDLHKGFGFSGRYISGFAYGFHPISLSRSLCHISPMKPFTLIKNSSISACLGAVVMMGLGGCVTNANPIDTLFGLIGTAGSGGRSAFQSETLYYPEYDIYYNRNTREFLSVENNRWVVRDRPRNISADRVLSSRAMSIDGYDSPEDHRNAYYQQNRYRSRQPQPYSSRGWNPYGRRVYR